MEDIGDFVVLRQLVTFCPQVVNYTVFTPILHISHYQLKILKRKKNQSKKSIKPTCDEYSIATVTNTYICTGYIITHTSSLLDIQVSKIVLPCRIGLLHIL